MLKESVCSFLNPLKIEFVNCFQDSKTVIDRYKSGFPIPGDLPFEDLSTTGPTEPSNNTMPRITTPSNTIKNATMSGKQKKRGGIFGLFGSSKVGMNLLDFCDFTVEDVH